MRFSSQSFIYRDRHDFIFTNGEFFPDPAGSAITAGTFAVASATELGANNIPISGGAHVTVQQVTPSDGQIIVRVWVDNVPVNINVRCSVVILD